MAKMEVTKKKVTKVCGRLDKREDGTFVIIVEDKDYVEEFELEPIIEDLCGDIISLSSEREL